MKLKHFNSFSSLVELVCNKSLLFMFLQCALTHFICCYFSVFFFFMPPPHLMPSPPQFKLPTSPPPTTKTVKVVTSTTSALTTSSPLITTVVTIATTSEPPTTPPGAGLTTRPSVQPPSTPLPPSTTSRTEDATAAWEQVVVTQRGPEDSAVTLSVAVATAKATPVTGADGVSGDLDPGVPLLISDTPTLEVATGSPHKDAQEVEGALSLAETLTLASSNLPLPTTFFEDEAADSGPHLNLDPTQIPTLLGSTSEAGGATPPVLLWSEAERLAEGVAENDTTMFSAPTVLSGDGEVEHEPPSYPQMMELDSEPEMDYQNDQADSFLPVSSACASVVLPSFFFFCPRSHSSLMFCPCSLWLSSMCCRTQE